MLIETVTVVLPFMAIHPQMPLQTAHHLVLRGLAAV